MTVERLRRDIDAGRTGDKSPGPDPAAAPLGTDDEAAGTPVPPGVAVAEGERARAVGAGLDSRQNAPAGDGTAPSRRSRSGLVVAGLTMVLAIVLAVAAVIAILAR